MSFVATITALLGIAACGSDGPSCNDAVARAAARFANSDSPEVATMIGRCEQGNWPTERRACFADAITSDALQACLPTLDVKVPLPVLEPSAATKKLVADGPGDVRALLFFSDDSDTARAVEPYLEQVTKIAVERHDVFVEAELAAKYQVARNGAIVLVRGDVSKTIALDNDLERASQPLRRFDQEFAYELARLVEPQRKAYFVAGHGEMTDRDSLPPPLASATPPRNATMLNRGLAELGFKVASLGSELATDVPADATVVLIFAPAVALSDGEQAALARYLERGGALLYALDPSAPPGLGALEAKLGVRFNHGHLTDDKQFYPRLKTAADHRYVVTNELTPHPTVNGLVRPGRLSMLGGLLLIDAGTLETIPTATASPTVTFTIRSKESGFIDLDGNFELSPATEKRDRYPVAAAIEGPKFRALVFADTDLFADLAVQGTAGRAPAVMLTSGPLFTDSVRWLSHDAEMAVIVPPNDRETPIDAKALIAAKLELAQRRLDRAYAGALAAGPHARDYATEHVRALQSDEAKLRSGVKP